MEKIKGKKGKERNYKSEAERSQICFDQETRASQDLLPLLTLLSIQKEMVIGR